MTRSPPAVYPPPMPNAQRATVKMNPPWVHAMALALRPATRIASASVVSPTTSAAAQTAWRPIAWQAAASNAEATRTPTVTAALSLTVSAATVNVCPRVFWKENLAKNAVGLAL